MFRGWVEFRADTRGTGLVFERCEFNPHEPGVDKVEIEGKDSGTFHESDFIRSRVFFSAVASEEAGREAGERVTTRALDRLTFQTGVVIQRLRRTSEDFSPLDPQPGLCGIEVARGGFACGGSAKEAIGLSADRVKETLGEVSPPGERFYGTLRAALRSSSPAEAFLHLYHLLLMLCNDSQAALDQFVRSADPAVPQTPRPDKPHVQETIYTRLRNEFAHPRSGVDLEGTKREMATHLGGLREVTKKAILLQP